MGDLDRLRVCSLEAMTLQDFALSLNPYLSKSALKKRFKKYYKNSKQIKSQEVVRVPLALLNYGKINPEFEESKIQCQIIYEDDSWIAINKGPGIHSHPLDYECTNNSLSFLASLNKYESLRVNSSAYDRGLLYRLDRETSGILIFAKEQALFDEVRHQFSEVAKSKTYLAKVEGDATAIKGEHIDFMQSSQKLGSKMIEADVLGLRARLEVLKIDYNKTENTSLLRVSLHTGVRHQIRYQLSNLGFPIIGDQLYDGKKAPRLYLHALEYKIKTQAQEICLNTGYPEDF